MYKVKPSSKELLKGVLEPHKELAVDLLKMVKSLDTSDSSHRFQIASIIIFLAGIDKTLSLAFELLYLAGKVEWNWMVKDPKSTPVGFIECQRGFTAKIFKLKEMGVDLTHFQSLIDLRNDYVHSCHIYLGYTLGLDEIESTTKLFPSAPVISFPNSPLTYLTIREIHSYTEQLINEIGSFVDKTEWQSEWLKITQKIEHLPKNPEPEYTEILNDPGRYSEIVDTLNRRYIGDGAKLLRE